MNDHVGIKLSSDRFVRTLNRQFRRIDRTTDILSFPLHTSLRPGQRPPKFAGVKDLGDMVMAPQYIRRYCERNAIADLQSYIARLACHGLLHLLGYDHINDADFELMHKQEQTLLEHLRQRDSTFTFNLTK